MDFMTRLPVLTDWKSKSYNLIFVILDRLTKIVYYKLVKVMINAPDFTEEIIDIMVWYHSLLDSIIIDQGSLFTLKFWFLLCYFLEIKKKLLTTFHSQIDGQTKRQNSIIEVYIKAFVKWEQNK